MAKTETSAPRRRAGRGRPAALALLGLLAALAPTGLLLGRRLAAGIHLLAAPSWVRDTPLLRDAWNVPLGLALELPRGALLELEVVPENRDLDTSEMAWHVAYSKAVGGHIFEVVAGNSRAVTVDQMLGGDFPGGFDGGDVRLGFNIVRDFGF